MADALTQHVEEVNIKYHTTHTQQFMRAGRHDIMLQIATSKCLHDDETDEQLHEVEFEAIISRSLVAQAIAPVIVPVRELSFLAREQPHG